MLQSMGSQRVGTTERLNNRQIHKATHEDIFLVAAEETLQFYQHQGNRRLLNLGTPKS